MRRNGLLILNSEKAFRDQMTKNTAEDAEEKAEKGKEISRFYAESFQD